MTNNWDRLKFFYHIYSCQSVVAAAKQLEVSQSAASQALKKLESEIKTPLFTRLPRKMIPTQAGDQLFEAVEPFMLNLENCLKTIERGKVHPSGELRIGAPLEFGKNAFPSIVAKFQQLYPEVRISLTLGNQNELLTILENGAIDFTLVDVFQNQPLYFGTLDLFEFTPIIKEEIVLACSKAYFDRSLHEDASFERLIEQNFITYRQDAQSVRAWFKHHFSKSNLFIQPAFVVDSHEAVVSAIKQDIGLGIVASHLIHNELLEEQIVVIQTNKAQIYNQISLVQLQDKVPTLTEKVFLEHFLKEIKR